MERRETWDDFFMRLAAVYSERSKDPSTKVGCVIVRPDRTVASMGFNGFPRNMEDRELRYINRDDKYKRTIHAEMNALLFALERLEGYTLYCSAIPCCSRCAVHIIQCGIKRVVVPCQDSEAQARWRDDTQLAMDYFMECGVKVDFIDV